MPQRILAAQPQHPFLQSPPIRALGDRSDGCDQLSPRQQVDLGNLGRLNTFAEIPPPGLEVVNPGLHRVTVDSLTIDFERCLPAIVDQRLHGDLSPGGLIRGTILQGTAHEIMPVAEDVGFHNDRFSDHALKRKSATIKLGLHVLNDDATPSVDVCHYRSTFLEARVGSLDFFVVK